MKAEPLFSVVIPAYNCEKFVAKAIKSALNQTISDVEVIVIYDPSADSSELIIDEILQKDSRVICIKNKTRMGTAENRNIGMSSANGTYIAFLDADDIWLPDKLEKQYNLIKNTNCDICYSSYSFIDDNDNDIGHPFIIKQAVNFRSMLYGNAIGMSTSVITKKLAKQYKMNKTYYHEDYVFWLALLKDGYTARGVVDVTVKYRFSVTSRSANKIHSSKHRLHIFRGFLEYNWIKSIWYFTIASIKAVIKYRNIITIKNQLRK